MTRLPYERYYRELEAETRRLAEAVGAGPAAPVPTCPEWTMTRLAEHVGRAHRWAGMLVIRRALAPISSREAPDRRMPEAEPQRSGWLAAGAADLVAAVRDAGPDTPVWTWTDERSAGFWARRMVHETAVHRADAELALGRDVELSPDLAADGISEWLTILPFARDTTRDALAGNGETLHLHATDDGLGPAGEWLIQRTPQGPVWEHGHGKGDAAIRAAATDLLLVLLRRKPLDDPRVEVLGDRAVADHWLAHTAF
jgi:uncharacterized protein (TIGR03083 family)